MKLFGIFRSLFRSEFGRYSLIAALMLAGGISILDYNRKTKTEPPAFISIRMETSESAVAQLFYDTGKGFSEEESVQTGFHATPSGLQIRFPLPKVPIQLMRFDPTNEMEAVTIRSIALETRNGITTKRFALDCIEPVKGLTELEQVRNGVIVRLTKNAPAVDSQVLLRLNYPLQLDSNDHLNSWGLIKKGLAISLLLWLLLLCGRMLWIMDWSGWSGKPTAVRRSDVVAEGDDGCNAPHTPNEGNWMLVGLGTLFFVSGFAALLYQVAWQRMLGLFCGSDVASMTVVVTAYLAGLGLGSLIGVYHSDRFRRDRAIRLYALMNIGIGGFAFLSPYLFYDVLSVRLVGLADSPLVMVVVVVLSLLFPTTLMGLSLPLISRAVTSDIGVAAGRISFLNGLNTIGAALGALVGGWYLVGTLGFDRAVYLGGFLSVSVGCFSWIIARRVRHLEDDKSDSPMAPPIHLGARSVSLWYWSSLVLVAGFLAISLEMVWFRVLDVSLRSNAYTFSFLLFWFLVGDGIGSLIGGRFVKKVTDAHKWFLALQGGLVIYSLAAVYLTHLAAQSGSFQVFLSSTSENTSIISSSNWLTIRVYLLLAVAIILPPSILIGLNFPFMQKAVQNDPSLVGQRVSMLQAANIGGNSLAGLISGMVLLHYLGTVNSLRILGVIGLVFLLVLMVCCFREKKTRHALVVFAISVLLLAGMVGFPGNASFWAPLHAKTITDEFDVCEDSSGVSAFRIIDGTAVMYADGRHQGRIPFLQIHVALGALPALIHSNPTNVMVIGLGSGGTAYGMGVNPATEEVLVVEIMSSQFPLINRYANSGRSEALTQMMADPRYQIGKGDGRRFLAQTDQRFDIIEADAVLPVSSGSGFLYSKEYFEQVRSCLKTGGLMAQWMPTQRVVDTFVSVFPYVISFGNVFLIGSNEPIEFDADLVQERIRDGRIADYLAKGGLDPVGFAHRLLNIWGPVRWWNPETPRGQLDINTDFLPKDEYYLNN